MEEASWYVFVRVGACVLQDPEQDPGFLVLATQYSSSSLNSSRYIKTISEASPPFTDCCLSVVQATV